MIIKHWLARFHFTAGVKHLADTDGCYWLVDEIAFAQPWLRTVPFQVWRLEVNLAKGTALLTAHADWSSQDPAAFPALYSKRIPFTDFPRASLKLYVEQGESAPVLLLPEEH